jgi:voltage-gated potassium channel Kch
MTIHPRRSPPRGNWPFVLARLLAHLRLLRGWATPIIVVVFVFTTSWPLMALAEPRGSSLVQPANYWWYFVVTSATVGYGDFFPVSGLGHLVGVYVITGGIVTLTTVFARLAIVLDRAKGRRMQGMTSVDVTGHVVLLGYVAGRTDRMIGQLQADGVGRVVLGAWDEVATHPTPDADVDFVRGELTREDVLRRAGVHRARAVLVDARDDHEALAITVAVGHVNSDAHLVIALRDIGKTSLFKYLSDDVRCVQWHVPRS